MKNEYDDEFTVTNIMDNEYLTKTNNKHCIKLLTHR